MVGKDKADDRNDPEPLSEESNGPDEREIDDDEGRNRDDEFRPEGFEDADFDCGPDSEG
jgi:hypothetical protein